MKFNHSFSVSRLVCVAVVALAFGQIKSTAAESASAAEMQRKLIAVLQSDAPPAEKAITCKKLAIYGSPEAVPVVAPLLLNPELSSWARIALEAIPGPAADAALRDAVAKLQGRLLIGVINSIGVRRDAKAVGVLAGKLADADAEVASAAAEALGHIGGDDAAKALEPLLATAPAGVRSSVALGCILCAENYLAAGQAADAVRLYDRVRQANVPRQRLLEATRGAILARQASGIPLLLEELRSADKARFEMALRTAREVPGRAATEALVAELERANPQRQVLLFLAITDRGDAAVLPKVLQVAQSGAPQIRVLALGMLDRFGDVSCVPVLLNASTEADAELAKTAKATLARLGGKEVDADLLARLSQSSGKTRQVLIELARLRRIEGALPLIVKSAEDADAGVRRAALETVGLLGTEAQAAELVRLLSKAQTPKDRGDVESALIAVCTRSGARCLPQVQPLVKSGDSSLRVVALQALASIGGAESLAAVNAAVSDPDEAVQDEAVRMLSTWPNKWPDDAGVAEPLLALAKSGKKPSYQLQGLRGYLQYVQEDKKLKNEEKLAKVNALLPMIQRPEEKRLLISVVSAIPTAGSLELLTSFTGDRSVAEEACLALVNNASDKAQKGTPKETRQKALQTVLDKSQNDATKKKAEAALKRLN